MRWQGRRESSNIEDRRGRGMGRSAGVGGIGMIIVLLVGIFFGVDLSPLLGPGGVVTTDSAPSGPNVVDDEQERFVAVVLGQTEDVWTPRFQAAGMQYSEPKLVLFSGQTSSACGFAQAAMGPFYCPGDQQIYIDPDFFDELSRRFGAPGDAAQAYVIAHEVGHHIQNLEGTLDRAQASQARLGEAEGNQVQVGVELQADCYAGVWAARSGALEQGDIEEGMRAAEAIGDDTLQKQTQGRVVPESFTHGSSAQRMEALRRGLSSGNPASCNYAR